jgi:hypothetical protein
MKLKIPHQQKLKLEEEYWQWLKIKNGDFKKIDCPYNFMTFLETKKYYQQEKEDGI